MPHFTQPSWIADSSTGDASGGTIPGSANEAKYIINYIIYTSNKTKSNHYSKENENQSQYCHSQGSNSPWVNDITLYFCKIFIIYTKLNLIDIK